MAHVTPQILPPEVDIRPGAKPKPAASQPGQGGAFDVHLEGAATDTQPIQSAPATGRPDDALPVNHSPGSQGESAAGTGLADTSTIGISDLLPVIPEAGEPAAPPDAAPQVDAAATPDVLPAPATAGQTVAALPSADGADSTPAADPAVAVSQAVADEHPIATDDPTQALAVAPAADVPANEAGEVPPDLTATNTETPSDTDLAGSPLPPVPEGTAPIGPEHPVVERPDKDAVEAGDDAGAEALPIAPDATIDEIAGTPIVPPLPGAGFDNAGTVQLATNAPAEPALPPSGETPDQPVAPAPPGPNGQTAEGLPPTTAAAKQPAIPHTPPQPAPVTAPAPTPAAAVAPTPAAAAPNQPATQPVAPTLPAAAPAIAGPEVTAPNQPAAQPAALAPQTQTASAPEPAPATGARTDPVAPAGTEKAVPPVVQASAAPKPATGLLDASSTPKPDVGSNPFGAPASSGNQAASKPTFTTALDVTGNGPASQAPARPGPAATGTATVTLDPLSPATGAPTSDPAMPTLPLAQNSHTISVRFGASPLPGSSAQMPVNTLAFNIARNFDNGVNRFEIRIDPPELGRVDVKLDMSVEGRVQAHLTVERSETLELMMRDARSLEKALADTGLSMSRDSLSFSLKDQNASGGGRSTDGDATDINDDSDTSGEDDQPADTARGYITDSGVDITV